MTLFCSILKKENFEWVVQKATEIGVSVIVPVLTKRTVKTGLNFERLNKIAREATEQSGRGTVPKIRQVVDFTDAIKMRKDFGQALILEQTSTGEPEIDQVGSVAILIGPEGGWEEDEISMALDDGWGAWSLGRTTLRAETAAIVAVAKAVRSK